jgi:hypothetical protein
VACLARNCRLCPTDILNRKIRLVLASSSVPMVRLSSSSASIATGKTSRARKVSSITAALLIGEISRATKRLLFIVAILSLSMKQGLLLVKRRHRVVPPLV